MELGGWEKIENVNTLQMSMKMSPNERGASISISKILDLREGLMECFKFEKKQWRYLNSKFLIINEKQNGRNLN